MNIPNLLSMFRLMLVPIFPIVYNSQLPHANWYAVGIYLLAGTTDVVDGFIARHTGQVTKLGRVLDPLADKAMAFCVLLTITVAGVVSPWAVLVIFVKELLMGIGAITMMHKENDVFGAVWVGKLSTVVFAGVIMSLTLWHESIPMLWQNIMLGVAVGLNVLALCVYLYLYLKHIKKKPETVE